MKRFIFLYGFSIFSMFFGSGNLVFPLTVGIGSNGNWLLGFLGFFCTGIILPFLGLFVIKLHRGNYNSFFGEAGKTAELIIPLFTLSLLGAFGVIPRCITVAHGGIEYLFPDISLMLFSAVFCVASFIICLNDKVMFSIIGKILTPILLIFLIVLITMGIYETETINLLPSNPAYDSFLIGFFKGYSTMDLFAAFFFSSLIFRQIEEAVDESDTKKIIRIALKPSLMGAALLAFVYLGFVYLGSHYSHVVDSTSSELLLPAIAKHLLGENGALVVAIIVIFSCLTTAVALNNIYARYLCTFKQIGDGRFPLVLLSTIILSFTVSLLDFDRIAAILTPLLEISYPALIVLTILSICLKGYKRLKTISFYSVVLAMILFG